MCQVTTEQTNAEQEPKLMQLLHLRAASRGACMYADGCALHISQVLMMMGSAKPLESAAVERRASRRRRGMRQHWNS